MCPSFAWFRKLVIPQIRNLAPLLCLICVTYHKEILLQTDRHTLSHSLDLQYRRGTFSFTHSFSLILKLWKFSSSLNSVVNWFHHILNSLSMIAPLLVFFRDTFWVFLQVIHVHILFVCQLCWTIGDSPCYYSTVSIMLQQSDTLLIVWDWAICILPSDQLSSLLFLSLEHIVQHYSALSVFSSPRIFYIFPAIVLCKLFLILLVRSQDVIVTQYSDI